MAGFIGGLAVGVAATVAYYRFANRVYHLGETLLKKADGDYVAAVNHVKGFVKAVVSHI